MSKIGQFLCGKYIFLKAGELISFYVTNKNCHMKCTRVNGALVFLILGKSIISRLCFRFSENITGMFVSRQS
jgi:hypothetical protein